MVSRPADAAILLTNVSMVCTPKGDFENHTGALDQTLSFLSGARYKGPMSLSSGGRLDISSSYAAMGHSCPPDHSRTFVKITLSRLCRSFDPFNCGNFARYRVSGFLEIIKSKLMMFLATSSAEMLTDKKENGVV